MAEVEVRGVRFNYQRMGAGPQRVVFVHGFVWDNLSSWYFTAGVPVSRRAEVLLYDLRGHGNSGQPADGYTLDDMVEDLAGILDRTGFGDKPVHLVGNSFGGLLVLAFALAHPERVESLVLVDALVPDETWIDMVSTTLEKGGSERDRVITESFREWTGRYKEPGNTRLAKVAERLVHGTTLLDDLGRSRSFGSEDFSRIRCPVLAFYGEHSEVRARGEQLTAVLPNCELQVLPGGSHVILLESAAELRDRIMEWLDRQPDAAGG